MSVPIAYLTVVLVWSTTPLGILWSAESMHPTLAVLLRMAIAVVIGYVVARSLSIQVPWHKQAVKLYGFSMLGLCFGMMLSYFASAYLSSGLMSLIFGLSPIVAGLLSQKILGDRRFTAVQKAALAVAITGLVFVCFEKVSLKSDAWIGLIMIFSAVVLFSISGVMIKTVKVAIHPLASTVGALTVSVPVYFVAWLLLDGQFEPATWSDRSIAAVAYLSVFGSLLGFIAYYYVLQKLSVAKVSLTTLITPIIAISLGAWLNEEVINTNLLVGASLVLIGLGLFQFGDKLPKQFYNKVKQLGYVLQIGVIVVMSGCACFELGKLMVPPCERSSIHYYA